MIFGKNEIKGLTLLTLANAFIIMSLEAEVEMLQKLENQCKPNIKKIKQYKDIISHRTKTINTIYKIQYEASRGMPRKWVVLQKKRVDKYNKLFAKQFDKRLMDWRKRRVNIDDEAIYTELDFVASELYDESVNRFNYNPEPLLSSMIDNLLKSPLSEYSTMTKEHKEIVKATINAFATDVEFNL